MSLDPTAREIWGGHNGAAQKPRRRRHTAAKLHDHKEAAPCSSALLPSVSIQTIVLGCGWARPPTILISHRASMSFFIIISTPSPFIAPPPGRRRHVHTLATPYRRSPEFARRWVSITPHSSLRHRYSSRTSVSTTQLHCAPRRASPSRLCLPGPIPGPTSHNGDSKHRDPDEHPGPARIRSSCQTIFSPLRYGLALCQPQQTKIMRRPVLLSSVCTAFHLSQGCGCQPAHTYVIPTPCCQLLQHTSDPLVPSSPGGQVFRTLALDTYLRAE